MEIFAYFGLLYEFNQFNSCFTLHTLSYLSLRLLWDVTSHPYTLQTIFIKI